MIWYNFCSTKREIRAEICILLHASRLWIHDDDDEIVKSMDEFCYELHDLGMQQSADVATWNYVSAPPCPSLPISRHCHCHLPRESSF